MQGRDCRFRLFWPHAERVELLTEELPGPVRMVDAGGGWWELEAKLPERDCRYKFLVDGRYCVPDYSAGDPEYDETGQLVSVLHLGEQRRAGRRVADRSRTAPDWVRIATGSPADRHPPGG